MEHIQHSKCWLVVMVLLATLTQYTLTEGHTEKARNAVLSNELDTLPTVNTDDVLTLPVPGRTADDGDSDGPEIDPEGSWINFVKRSRNKRKPKRRNKQPVFEDVQVTRRSGQRGMDVNNQMSVNTVMRELRSLVKEEVDKSMQNRCPECVHNVTLRPLPRVDVAMLPRISTAFSIKLKHNAPIKESTMSELRNYYVPYNQGVPQRGDHFEIKHGRFIAPTSGMYQLAAVLHIAHDGYKRRRPRKLKRTDNLKAIICIQSLCTKFGSIDYISGLESNSRTFTIALNGILELKAGQYVSVFVNNQSQRQVTVLKESAFTGLLIGG